MLSYDGSVSSNFMDKSQGVSLLDDPRNFDHDGQWEHLIDQDVAAEIPKEFLEEHMLYLQKQKEKDAPIPKEYLAMQWAEHEKGEKDEEEGDWEGEEENLDEFDEEGDPFPLSFAAALLSGSGYSAPSNGFIPAPPEAYASNAGGKSKKKRAAKRKRIDDFGLDNGETKKQRLDMTPAEIPTEAPPTADFDNGHSRFGVLDEVDLRHLYVQNPMTWSADVSKLVSKEWKLMNSTVPDRVYFRGYSNRMDLQRFLIIGAPGTVYYNSYLLFDMQLPQNYPNVPPAVRFHAFNYRINPNLYNCGKVCLSLLGTWQGSHQVEHWNPKSSNMLQVASSIQGLILGPDEPYYNEPGFQFSKPNTPQSLHYNLEAVVMSLQIMIQMVNNGPAEFLPIIRDHFKSCANESMTLVRFCADMGKKGKKPQRTPAIEALLKKYRIVLLGTQHANGKFYNDMAFKVLPGLEKAYKDFATPSILSYM